MPRMPGAFAVLWILLSAACLAHAVPPEANADPLLAIDLNRSAIIADIVKGFEAQAGSPGAAGLRERLDKLRADRLLAASLASSRASLDAILAEAESPRSSTYASVREKALGDANRDLVYVPIVPCPLVNTFTSPIGRLPAGSITAFDAIAADFTLQGGQNSCATQLPANTAAIAAQIAVVSPSNEGWLNLWPVGQALPNNVTLGYYRNQAGDMPNIVTTSAVVPLCTGACAGGKEFNLYTAAEAVVTVAVVGYFAPPQGGAVSSIATGAGLTGGPITGSGTIALKATNLLPEIACEKNQVPKWNGGAWACAADAVGGGTVTSVAAGTGLSGGPITGAGTIAVADGGIGPAQLADFAVTTGKLADGAVTAAKLSGSGCTTDQVLKYNGSAWVCAADANSGAPLPTVLVASLASCCTGIDVTGETNAAQILIKTAPSPSAKYLARVDAQLNNLGSLYFDYHCKLQALPYPYVFIIGAPIPWVDLPGTRRDVSWRAGKDSAANSTGARGISISMQAPVTAGTFGLDVRLVCWGTWDGTSPPIVDFGLGVESAVLTLLPVGGFS